MNDADLIEKYKPRLGNASYGKNCIRYRDAEAIKWDVLDVMLHETSFFIEYFIIIYPKEEKDRKKNYNTLR